MSRQNVELVHAAWRHYAARDVESLLPHLAPEIELDVSAPGFLFEEDVYRGIDGVRRFYDEWLSTWDSFDSWIEESVDAGADVVTVARHTGVAKGSGVTVEMSFAQIATFADGRVVRLRFFLTHEEALEALASRE